MDASLIYKIIGTILIAVGIILVSNPELVTNKPVPEDVFRAVERRVWWGLFISAGVLLIFHHELRSPLVIFVGASTTITFGLLAARLIGIALDGAVVKQWFWVVVEAVILAALVWWYTKVRV